MTEPARGNLHTAIPASLPDELTETLVRCTGCRIERIVSRGHASPPGFWYDQAEDEWVLLVTGSATLELLDPVETLHLAAGDWVLLPAGRRHRVVRTAAGTDTVWLAVFMERKNNETR